MIYTGIDGDKWVSVDFSLLKRTWSVTERRGKKVVAVPSTLSFVKVDSTEIKDPYDLKRALGIEIEEKFGEVLWDVKLRGDKYCLALIRDFTPPEDAFSLEPEVFSLARVCRVLSLEECYVLDLGRRKTTLVRVSEGELRSYRVSMKGGDYITEFLSEKVGVGIEEAERIKVSEGLKNKYVEEAFGNILSSLGRNVRDNLVLLSGGGSKMVGIDRFFDKVVRNESVSPELNTAFGAALKFVYGDCSPDFREEELSDRELKRVALLLGASFILFLASNLSLGFIEKRVVREVREAERKAFREVFPELPAVAVRDQVKSMLAGGSYELTSDLLKLADRLKEGIEIYRMEFSNGRLKVVGSTAKEELATEVGAKSVKKTPEGTYEFEVEIE